MLTFNDETPMPFGKHKGTPLGQVPAAYLMWVQENVEADTPVRGALRAYIEENHAAIEMELQEDEASHRPHGKRNTRW